MMTEDEVIEYTNKELANIKRQAGPLSKEDCIEIKKWMRIVALFPQRKTWQFLPKWKKFHKRYGLALSIIDPNLIFRLLSEVYKELKVEPLNDKDLEYVGKGVIHTIIERSKINEEKEI